MDTRLAMLDLELFQHIQSQTSENDKRSLLAIQSAVRARGEYVYLEIGSHLGGSLQPFLVDDRCRKVISIDSRPQDQPDARLPEGELYHYEGNSTDRMLDLLGEIPGADLSKLHTIDASTENVAAEALDERPNLCFIDGEHTNQATLRDAVFCLTVAAPNAVIVFHDAHAVREAIGAVLRTHGGFGYRMRDAVFVIERDVPQVFSSVTAHVRQPGIWRHANRVGVAGALAAAGDRGARLLGRVLRARARAQVR